MYTKKARLTRDRRVVLFKQMIASMNKIVTILRTLDKFENDMQHTSSEMQEAIRNQLDHLMDYHDRILQRYVGKVTTHLTEEMAEEVDEGRVSLTDQLMEMYDRQNIDRSEWLHLLQLSHTSSSIMSSLNTSTGLLRPISVTTAAKTFLP
ncbi:hypothetical protein ACFOLK_17410 [Marinococcus halophilus]|uniref:hypothetical protein n=1 Tax=Marinococcus halophilus TaxID=1371 RepID=UPI0036206719